MTLFAQQIRAVCDPVSGIGDADEGFVDPAQAAGLANAANESPSGFPTFACTHPRVLMEPDAAERAGFVDDSSHPGVISAPLPRGLVVDPSTAVLSGLLV